jgi:hypothetical protein
MVEVIHPGHAQKRAVQNKYAARVADHLRDVFPRLVGVRIQLDDGYQDPPSPPLTFVDPGCQLTDDAQRQRDRAQLWAGLGNRTPKSALGAAKVEQGRQRSPTGR